MVLFQQCDLLFTGAWHPGIGPAILYIRYSFTQPIPEAPCPFAAPY